MQLQQLLDTAKNVTGSDSATARELGVRPQIVSDWRAGIRTCTAEDRALIADVAHVDPIPEIVAALIERCNGKPKAERLRTVFAKRLQNVGNSCLSLILGLRRKPHRKR